jgi:adenylate cyclase
VHTGQVVVGNIGSSERMKYGVVGSHVNLTSRIQSYTTGGQILISEATLQEVGRILKIGNQTEVRAKGIENPITLYEVLGIGGQYKLRLPSMAAELFPLAEEIPFQYEVVEGSHLGGPMCKGSLISLSLKGAEARLETPVPLLSNLKIVLATDGQPIRGALYAKVVEMVSESGAGFSIRFTSLPPDVETFLRAKIAARDTENTSESGTVPLENKPPKKAE